MKFTSRKQANEFYADILHDAEKDGCIVKTMNELGRRDLFFLLTRLLHRRDIDRDWLFDRCSEVQQRPDGYLDLWAREHYKSTLITFGRTIQDVLDSHSADSFHWSQEVTAGIFSCTRPIAKAFLAQIMQEFEHNTLLKEVYPDVLWDNPRREAPKWSLDSGIIVKRKGNPKEATVEAWGLVDGQPTSKHFNLLVYDDVVTLESVTTPEMIAKVTERWAVSLNLGAHGGRRRHIGTRYHFNDTYRSMMEREAVTPRIYPATDTGKPDGKPVFLSAESLAGKRRDMGPYVFGCQMLQNPTADEAQGFQLDWLRFYPSIESDLFNRYILVDPAGEKKKGSDYTSMVVIGLGPDRNYYLIDGIRDRLNLTERTKKLFEFHKKYRPLAVGYEKYGKDSDIEHIEDKQHQETYHFDITPLGGPMPKFDRIRKLIPIFENGRFWMPHHLPFMLHDGKMADYVKLFVDEEYICFPVCIHDDMLDNIARIVDPDLGADFPDPDAIGGFYDELNKGQESYDPFANL
jgi:phage terminase large subunit-like protein